MSEVHSEIFGIDELGARLKDLSDNLQSKVLQEIEASGQVIVGAAQGRTPVNTGLLRASTTAVPLGNGIEIVNPLSYAPYVEFGTGVLTDVPEGLETYAIQFKGEGVRKVNIPAKPFLFNSYYEEKPNLIANIKNVISA